MCVILSDSCLYKTISHNKCRQPKMCKCVFGSSYTIFMWLLKALFIFFNERGKYVYLARQRPFSLCLYTTNPNPCLHLKPLTLKYSICSPTLLVNIGSQSLTVCWTSWIICNDHVMYYAEYIWGGLNIES